MFHLSSHPCSHLHNIAGESLFHLSSYLWRFIASCSSVYKSMSNEAMLTIVLQVIIDSLFLAFDSGCLLAKESVRFLSFGWKWQRLYLGRSHSKTLATFFFHVVLFKPTDCLSGLRCRPCCSKLLAIII